jgi:DnaA family protein
MNKIEQLTFPWSKPNNSSFNDFYFEKNNLLVLGNLKGEEDLVIYGSSKVGKSFLLQSLCNYFSQAGKSSLYIPLKELNSHETELLDNLEKLNLVCIDDLEIIAGNNKWETAIFNLINECLLSKCRIVFCSNINPSSIKFVLNDLMSRIKKINQIEVCPVQSDNLSDAIKFLADLRSIKIGNKEITYLINHSRRSMSELVAHVNQLDKLSMQLKRKITIPLIKQVIES